LPFVSDEDLAPVFGTLGGGEFRLDVVTPEKVHIRGGGGCDGDDAYSSDVGVEYLSRAETPEPITAPSAATAHINPQRTATASIKLAPSPKIQRARSKSPNPRYARQFRKIVFFGVLYLTDSSLIYMFHVLVPTNTFKMQSDPLVIVREKGTDH
jgi:hypothetical protein